MESIVIQFFLIIIGISTSCSENCTEIALTCNQENSCQNCIRAHYCCHWCFDESFSGYRCNIRNHIEFVTCNPNFILNNTKTKAEINLDLPFTDVQNNISQTVQFRPSEITVHLRIGEPINVTVQYQPAKNFPLDLYYLMDLTKSMQQDLITLRELGVGITSTLEKLTKNYQIAFGSYIDKPEMPFYFTDKEQYENPCQISGEQCEMGYLFKHKLNFTKNIDHFIKEVNRSHVSANLDNLEGGMDAIMQILLCNEKLGWSKNSRKLILVATEGLMHFAGDGILSGSVKRNRKSCLVNATGFYEHSIRHDYPSLEEIYHELKSRKVNLIFASKINSLDYYKNLSSLIDEASFVGELQLDSTNVLGLVEEGYYDFIKQVTILANTSHIDGLEVGFFADCLGNRNWERTDTCMHAAEGKVTNFTVQFLLKKRQDVDQDVIYIEEANINEKIKINLKFVDSNCNCPSVQTQFCEHGTSDCGNCTCDYGWTGSHCNEVCDNNINNCRFEENGILSFTCSSNGDCICSKCDCYFPYIGVYCEHRCPLEQSSNLICGGHGKCSKGECQCYDNYNGTECTCFKATEGCAIPGTETLCNQNGVCKCNECECKMGFSGKYCDVCEECQGLCSNYEQFVVDEVVNKKTEKNENKKINIEMVDKIDENLLVCVYRFEGENGAKCDVLYTYTFRTEEYVDLKAQKPNCNKPLGASTAIGIIIGTIFGLGLLAILIWKGRSIYRDKIEYEKFVKSREGQFHSEQNPLYRSPVIQYENPMELVNLHRKNE